MEQNQHGRMVQMRRCIEIVFKSTDAIVSARCERNNRTEAGVAVAVAAALRPDLSFSF